MFNIQKYIELFKINNKFRISIILIAVSLLAILIGVVALFLNRTTVTYTVTFDSAGGTTITEQVVKSGEKVKKPNDPIKEGYCFREWQYQG